MIPRHEEDFDPDEAGKPLSGFAKALLALYVAVMAGGAAYLFWGWP